MSNLQFIDDSGLEAAKRRVRALKRLMGFGCGVVMMAAGDSVEQKRAAWRARNDRRRNRNKSGLSRIVIEDVPHDTFIGAMLELGVVCQTGGPRAQLQGGPESVRESNTRSRVFYTRDGKAIAVTCG